MVAYLDKTDAPAQQMVAINATEGAGEKGLATLLNALEKTSARNEEPVNTAFATSIKRLGASSTALNTLLAKVESPNETVRTLAEGLVVSKINDWKAKKSYNTDSVFNTLTELEKHGNPKIKSAAAQAVVAKHVDDIAGIKVSEHYNNDATRKQLKQKQNDQRLAQAIRDAAKTKLDALDVEQASVAEKVKAIEDISVSSHYNNSSTRNKLKKQKDDATLAREVRDAADAKLNALATEKKRRDKLEAKRLEALRRTSTPTPGYPSTTHCSTGTSSTHRSDDSNHWGGGCSDSTKTNTDYSGWGGGSSSSYTPDPSPPSDPPPSNDSWT